MSADLTDTGVFGTSSSSLVWYSDARILKVAADRTVDSVLRRIAAESADWIVVVRPHPENSRVYYYAFRRKEVDAVAVQYPERRGWSLEQAMDLHEWKSTGTSGAPGGAQAAPGDYGPAAARVIRFDARGQISAIGDPQHAAAAADDRWTGAASPMSAPVPSAGPRDRVYDLDLGEFRGGGGGGGGGELRSEPEPAGPPEPAEIDITFSAETFAQIEVAATVRVPFQIELSVQALPLAVRGRAQAKKDALIVVSLSAENDSIEIVGRAQFEVPPPQEHDPRAGFFAIKGVRPGDCRLALLFRQGGSDLGAIGLAVQVVEAKTNTEKARGEAVAAPRDIADDDKLALLVEQRVEGGQVFYEYTLHSEALNLPYRKVRSKPLLDRGGGAAATALAFVERIYARVTQELRTLDDLKELQREARALGANLCQELFDPEVAKLLWPLRQHIKLVQIVSWEPYIPWELVRLRDPVSGDIDDRFLCEYGLVRTLSDAMPTHKLPMRRWAYLGAKYPGNSFPPVGRELDYFTQVSAATLRGKGITPVSIAGTRDAFYDALSDAEFDVLHISCHAESQHQSIERASLIIGDEPARAGGKPQLIGVDTVTVEAEARLDKRRPLVFLNACETGRIGAVLTAWGGWPNVFLRKGAGAFVGCAWAVRDKPAAIFSTSFYNAMLDGRTLAEAASAARAAAKEVGDASWLAFKVYGHPRARAERN